MFDRVIVKSVARLPSESKVLIENESVCDAAGAGVRVARSL
jgi:hypothetical protein